MVKRIIKMAIFNLCLLAVGFAIMSNRGLGYNFLNFRLSPFKFGVSWAITFFGLGLFAYVNYLNIQIISNYMKHAEKLIVKDVVLTDISDALQKLIVAKRENNRLNSQISKVYSIVKEFQNKLDILNQLLANHGEKISNWSWIVEFNNESQHEILANVREVIDTSIIFDNQNAKDNNLESAILKIRASIERMNAINKKYDEFLDIVQKVLEKKLRSHGVVVTDSLDVTIKSVKQVYGIDDKK